MSDAQRLMTHHGVGPLTALAFVLIIGHAKRFRRGKQAVIYLGLVLLEDYGGDRRGTIIQYAPAVDIAGFRFRGTSSFRNT